MLATVTFRYVVPAAALGSAEVPFAMLFAWTFLGELPPAPSVAGGALVLGAVVFHALRSRRNPPTIPAG